MFKSRRKFLKTLATIHICGFTVMSGYLYSAAAHATQIAENFDLTSFDKTIKRLFNNRKIINSHKINISRLPQVTENSAAVPITITSTLTNVEKIFILIPKNPSPLSAEFLLSPMLVTHVSARLKIAKSGLVVIILQTKDNLYRTSRFVEVAVGGCGS